MDEITYHFPNFKRAIVDVSEWISNSIAHFNGCGGINPGWDYRGSMLVKKIHAFKVTMVSPGLWPGYTTYKYSSRTYNAD